MRIIILFVTFIFALLIRAGASPAPTLQTPDEIKSKLPQVAGWTIDTMEIFVPDNLYDRINGAAPGYIMFNFKELTAFEYIKNGTDDDLPPYISVQVYRHATAEDAYGIYASERPSKTTFLTIGAEGYQEGSMLNFFADHFYVKIESPLADENIVKTVTQIAQGFSSNVNPNPIFPKQLQCFPADNKINRSELYIPSGYLGHEFLNKAFTANYEVSGKKYQLFIIDAGSVELAKTTLTKYLQFTKQKIKLREGRLTINDRFNGVIECQWRGRYMWGIVNDNKADVNVNEILNMIGKKLD